MRNEYIRVSQLLLLLLIIVISACSNQKAGDKLSDPSAITVNAGETDLTGALKKNEGVELAGKDDSTLFESILADKNSTIPYVKMGERITVDFGDLPSDRYVLYDYVLDEDGTIKYTSLATETVSLEVSNNVGTFQLNRSLSSHFSSNSKDYEAGNLLRGFLLTTASGEQQQEYAFVIRSDGSEAN